MWMPPINIVNVKILQANMLFRQQTKKTDCTNIRFFVICTQLNTTSYQFIVHAEPTGRTSIF